MMTCSAPIAIAPARVWRSYRGGSLIGQIHRKEEQDGHYPEEWLMSVIEAHNPKEVTTPGEGLSMLLDGSMSLQDAILMDPERMMGAGRTSPGVLMKILDAAERLSVQVHPTKEMAQALFHSSYGKTECWHIIDCRWNNRERPYIYFGFRPGISRTIWEDLFKRQDIAGMLRCLHKIDVTPGETYLIEGGMPHAIGAGCLIAEIQEPSDLTLRVERVSASGKYLPDENCHQGVGFERMLDCFCYNGISKDELLRRWRIPPVQIGKEAGSEIVSLVDDRCTVLFSMEKLYIYEEALVFPRKRFHGLYVLSGDGLCICNGNEEEIKAGSQYFVPAACEAYTLRANTSPMVILRWYGP